MRLAALTAAAVMPAACAPGLRPVAEGRHVDGLRHGAWRTAHPDGSAEEGRYVAGRLHGEWVFRGAEGRIVARELRCNGRAVTSGEAVCD